jgi:beta-fructofuranosidase
LFIQQIDHSVVESYGGGGRTVITARVYPEHAETSNNRLLMFNNGTGMVKVSKLDAWELKAADVNVPGDGLITIGSMHLPEAY